MKKALYGIILLLVAVLGVTTYLNRQQAAESRRAQDEAFITVRWSENSSATIDMQAIRQLPADEFQITQRSSNQAPSEQTYKGVELRRVFEAVEAPLGSSQQVTVRAADGYAVALTLAEVQDSENIYLVYERNGQPLGKKEDGGIGPFQMVIRKDQFAQRWCKFVSELELR